MSTIKANTIQPIGGSDSLKIRTNDLDSLTVNSSGDITVRGALNVDSGTLVVDSTNNRVGIGTGVPNVPLDIRGGSVRADTSGAFEQSVAFSATVGNWARGLNFVDSNAVGTLTGITSGIGMFGSGTTPNHLFLGFGSTPWNSGSQAGGVSGGVFILKTGNIGVGTDTPLTKLHVKSSSQPANTSNITQMNLMSNFTLVVDSQNTVGTGDTPVFTGGLAFAATATSTKPLGAIIYSGHGQGGGIHIATANSYTIGLNQVGLSVHNGKVGINNNFNPAVALDVNGEARSSTSTTVSSHANTLVTKDFVDFEHLDITFDDFGNGYGNPHSGSQAAPTWTGSTVNYVGGALTAQNVTTIDVATLRRNAMYTFVHRTVSSQTPSFPPYTSWTINSDNEICIVMSGLFITPSNVPYSSLSFANTSVQTAGADGVFRSGQSLVWPSGLSNGAPFPGASFAEWSGWLHHTIFYKNGYTFKTPRHGNWISGTYPNPNGTYGYSVVQIMRVK